AASGRRPGPAADRAGGRAADAGARRDRDADPHLAAVVARAAGRKRAVRASRLVLSLVVVALLTASLSAMFVVNATEYAIVTRFGRPVRTALDPGLHWKAPFVDQVVRLDARLLLTEPPVAEYLTLDKKNVVVRPFLTWRVDDPLRYLQTVLIRDAAEARLTA